MECIVEQGLEAKIATALLEAQGKASLVNCDDASWVT